VLIKRIGFALVIILLVSIILPISTASATNVLDVHFERVAETPVNVTFRVTISGSSEDLENIQIKLEDLSFDVNELKDIDVSRVDREHYYTDKPTYATNFFSIKDRLAKLEKDLSEGAIEEKEYLLKLQADGENVYPVRTLESHHYTGKLREVKVPVQKITSLYERIEFNKQVARSPPTARVDSPIALSLLPTIVNWDVDTRVYEITINTGSQQREGGGWGSAGLLKLNINGIDYFDDTNSSWWNTNWNYRKKLTFDNSAQTTDDLIKFPVLVHLDDTNINWTHVQNAGEDIRFVDANDTTALEYEIETWDDTNDAWIWVKVPQIDKASDTDFIYMYYGNDGAGDNQNANLTWRSEYKGVWHLNKDAGDVLDTSGNNNDGANNNATRQQPGQVGFGFDFNGTTAYVEVDDDDTLDITQELTVEAWIEADAIPDTIQTVVGKWGAGWATINYLLATDDLDASRLSVADGVVHSKALNNESITIDTWYYIVGRYSKTEGKVKIFTNGELGDVVVDESDNLAITGNPLIFGNNTATGGFWYNGAIDEVRIAEIAFSDDWIAAQYLSMTDAFITFGDEKGHPSVTTYACTGFGSNWAIVNGTLTDDGGLSVTEIGFDYGLTDAYGSSLTTTGSWAVGDSFVLTLTGLSAGSNYHFRAKVYNGAWGYGSDMTFSTEGSLTLYEHLNALDDGDSGDIYGNNWEAQQFTVGATSHTASEIWLYLKRTGADPGIVTVSLRHADAAHKPTGLDLASDTMDGSLLGEAYNWWKFDIGEISLEATKEYAIVVRAVAGDDAQDVQWASDTGGSLDDAISSASADSGSSWTVDGGDADYLFELWGNPCINVIGANVFRGYLEDDDMLFTVHYQNTYVPYYPDDLSARYFDLRLYDTDGTTLIATTVCRDWGNKPGAIYLSADSAVPLTEGSAYYVKLYGDFTGNPTAAYQLQAIDWSGDDLVQLDDWVIVTAHTMATYYNTDFTTFLVGEAGQEVLNTEGGVIFAKGIPGLPQIRPDLFELTSGVEGYDPEDWTHAFVGETTWQDQVGTGTATALTATGNLFGIDGKAVGAFILLACWLAIGIAVVGKGGDSVIAIILAVPFILLGAWLRLIDIAIVGVTAGVVILMLSYRFWWSRT